MTDIAPAGHADLMDRIYRHQKHFYDVTRKYYLLGRDRLIAELDLPRGAKVLEVGCGTGRNLAKIAGAYPTAALHGLDISREMLAAARTALNRRDIVAALAQGDASDFAAEKLFGRKMDRVILSYALSMIPDWPAAIRCALAALAPGGRLHIVDFGSQARLPAWFRRLLFAWLARFEVTPRVDLESELVRQAAEIGAAVEFREILRGYALLGTVHR
jgi:S-adenosylmethionine-diacylgycerolhomoserine-N-methlytransferase